jgi:hypothetical protein
MDSHTAVVETAGYYTWNGPVDIRISAEALDRILADAFRGMGLLPRRGVEVGGLLLGTVSAGAAPSLEIEDILAVPIEYAFGPAYRLSENDKEQLREVLRRWERSPGRPAYAIGFYRTQTREGLSLTAEDLRMFSDYFPDPVSLALLIRPGLGKSEAAIFLRDRGGELKADTSYMEFSIGPRSPKSPARTRPAATPDATVSSLREPEMEPPRPPFVNGAPPEPAEAMPEPKDTPSRQPLWVSWWVQVPILAGLLVADGLLGFVSARQIQPTPAQTQATAKDPYALSLLVVEYGDNLHLTWDREAPALASAAGGMLTISDGGQTRSLDLSLDQLRDGSVTYRRLSTRVRLRLEVFLKGKRSLSETWELRPELP